MSPFSTFPPANVCWPGSPMVAVDRAVLHRAGPAQPRLSSGTTIIKSRSSPSSPTWHGPGSEGHWPLLSPYSWACGNLAGEYQYGTFSLFVNAVGRVAVFALWSDFALQAAALSILHLAALGTRAPICSRADGGCRRRWRPWWSLIDRGAQRLGNRLGGHRLVRRAGGRCVAAVVLVGV